MESYLCRTAAPQEPFGFSLLRAANTTGAQSAAGQVSQAIVILANPDFVMRSWLPSVFAWAVVLLSIFANTLLIRKLPMIEGIAMFAHVLGFFAFIVVLWVMAPRGDSTVLTTFESNGWPSAGVASLVGISAAVGDLIGADSSLHLAEELKNASWVLPRSMVATALVNYVLGFVAVVTLVFCLGDLNAALTSSTGQPFVEVLLNATESTGATIALTAVMLVLLISCAINNITCCSRQLWSEKPCRFIYG
ncbi:hypothetical protein LTR08_001008 [Meristemomyces frigidus]|nr:hypothetical protein LTR08_001008 [Meristemomyces frigidus]